MAKVIQKYRFAVIFLLLSLGFTQIYAQRYNIDWLNAIKGNNWPSRIVANRTDYSEEHIISIVSDKNANIYSLGYFNDTLDFDPGAGNLIVPQARENRGVFISKTNANGNIIWVRKISGKSGLTISIANHSKISIDNSDNLYITGDFRDTIDCDPGPNVYNLIPRKMSGFNGGNTFVIKLDSGGHFNWAKQLEGSFWNNTVVNDATGCTYVTGLTLNPDSIDLDPGPGIVKFGPPVNSMYVLKLDQLGSYAWAKGLTAPDTVSNDYSVIIPYSLAVDPDNNILITGNYTASIDFDPSNNSIHTLTSSYDPIYDFYSEDIFICKLNSAGDYLWAKSIGNASGGDCGYSIACDEKGNVYTTGYFGLPWGVDVLPYDFDPGPNSFTLTPIGPGDIFISKLDADGNFRWAKRLGGIDFDQGNSISISKSGLVYTAGSGSTGDTSALPIMDLDPNAEIYNVQGPLTGGLHHIISVLDTGGNFVWGNIIGPAGGIALFPYERSAVTHDEQGSIYLGGEYKYLLKKDSSIYFDPGPDEFLVNYGGGTDIFLLKLAPCYEYNTTSISACNKFTFQGKDYIQSGRYMDTSHTRGICDSIFILDLILGSSSTDTLHVNACDSFSYFQQIYTTSGTYTHNYRSMLECDSIVIMKLIIDGTTPDTSVLQLGNTLTSLAPNVSYQWVNCGNGYMPVNGATDQAFSPTSNGNYAVIVTGMGGCTDTSNCYTITGLTNIPELGQGNKILFYPNPIDEGITIESSLGLKNATIKLINSIGQIVWQQAAVTGYKIYLDTTVFTSGFYSIDINEGGKSVRFKIVKK